MARGRSPRLSHQPIRPITTLAGGVGAAKFLRGLMRAAGQPRLSVIVNTGYDDEFYGLHVSPDLDSITYALAGVLSHERGWGYEGDTFSCLQRMRQMGAPGWFQLGDLDLATHLRRTPLLAEGRSLTEATAEIARAQVWSWVHAGTFDAEQVLAELGSVEAGDEAKELFAEVALG